MPYRDSDHKPSPDGEVIATFGTARLIKRLDRRCEVVGGSPADRAEAEKWMAMFLNKDVVRSSTQRPG